MGRRLRERRAFSERDAWLRRQLLRRGVVLRVRVAVGRVRHVFLELLSVAIAVLFVVARLAQHARLVDRDRDDEGGDVRLGVFRDMFAGVVVGRRFEADVELRGAVRIHHERHGNTVGDLACLGVHDLHLRGLDAAGVVLGVAPAELAAVEVFAAGDGGVGRGLLHAARLLLVAREADEAVGHEQGERDDGSEKVLDVTWHGFPS